MMISNRFTSYHIEKQQNYGIYLRCVESIPIEIDNTQNINAFLM